MYGAEPPYSSSDWLVHVAFVSSVGQSRARGMRLVWFMEKILGFFVPRSRIMCIHATCDGNFVLHEERCELKSYTGMLKVTV